jgi:tRNA pseudouridine13 synthase
LLAPDSHFTDETVQKAVEWSLAKEKLTLPEIQIKEAPHQLFFRHEDRPLLVYPEKLVIGKSSADELNRGVLKLNVAFTLPPGSYATLVIRRLFHFCYREDTRAEIQATPTTILQPREIRPPAASTHRPSAPGNRLRFRRKDGKRRDF